jgi:chemotaxis response regulator CheB
MKSIKILITGEDEAGQELISKLISSMIEEEGYYINEMKTNGISKIIKYRAWAFIEDFDVDIMTVNCSMNIEDQVVTLTKLK